ncbi:uncharacterized protein LOC129756854 isoform X2 [Uranotaenia lowii]|uniref:uncharacterized protein LOC129756854 isoform X2 n=1 Tax=Uranotaenia lowii TaxID=190385 RepID=UPI002478FFCB|nr:uncharacterized protein LOC129756854 isoform X2 [Uranotaenia lowii]
MTWEDTAAAMTDEIIAIIKARPDEFNVLTHGDAWCNNFLFRYDQNQDWKTSLAEIKLIDFQLCVWTSPVIDLLYFFFSSVSAKIRLPQIDSLICYYHGQLVDSLKFLGYSKPAPTVKELHLDFIDRIAYGHMTCFSILPICLLEKTEDASIETMMSADAGDAFRRNMYCNPTYVKQMSELVPYFYDLGAFDFKHCGYQKPCGIRSDFLNLPGWMRKEFFGEVIERKLGLAAGQYALKDGWAEIATSKGDNYGSIMYRVKLDVEDRTRNSTNSFSVVVKTRPTGIAAELAGRQFTKEIEMFTKFIPAFEKLYRDKGADVKIGPKCYKVCRDVPNDIMVMEDLLTKNFKPTARSEGIGLEQAELILVRLAEFHAASAVHHQKEGTFPEEFKEGLFRKDNANLLEFMFGPCYDACISEMENQSFGTKYIASLKKLRPTTFTGTYEATALDPEAFNVLNHGDFWCNNMMFKYGPDGQLHDSKLVDFQMCFYGSPVLDLHYAIFSSMRPEIRISKMNHLIRFYHEKLIDNLVLLDYGKPLPTLKQLQIDFYDRICYGAVTCFGILALRTLDPAEEVSMEAISQETEAGRHCRKVMYGNERYIREMEQLLPFLDGKGYFDPEAQLVRVVKKKSSC